MSITLGIILACCAASFWAFNDINIRDKWVFSPYQVTHHKEWYRVLTHAFIHADFMHLFFNMFVLYTFCESQHGSIGLEDMYSIRFNEKGWYFYVLLYFGGLLFATLPAFQKHSNNAHYRSLGASGAVSAVLFSFIVFEPTRSLYFIFLPGVPSPAFILGIGYLAYEYYMDKRGGSIIAHDAHFYGALYGIIFTIAIDYRVLEEFVVEIKNYF